MKRLKVEFAEMLQSTTGKLLDQIRVRDFNLGRTFPIIRQATVHNVSVNEDSMIEVINFRIFSKLNLLFIYFIKKIENIPLLYPNNKVVSFFRKSPCCLT